MESFTSEFLNTFADTIQDESTHIIECVDGKKKWLFYFVEGQLALTKSNLKHEQTEAIRESDPDASASDIPLIQATMRVSECISIETINIKTTSKMPSSTISTMDAMIGGLEAFLQDNEEAIEAIRSGLERMRPKLIQPVDTQHPELPNFMATLKGNLRSPVCISNFGLDNTLGWATLWSLQAISLFEEEEVEKSLSEILGFDLEALLAEEVAKEDEIFEEPEPEVETVAEETVAGETPTPAVPIISAEELESLDELEAHIANATNHFEILGVAQDGTPEDFRRAFFDLSKKLHPDRFNGGDEALIARATGLFDQVREAHETLSDDEARATYIDTVINGNATSEEAAMEQLQAIWKAEESFKNGLRLFQQGQLARAHTFFEEAHQNDPNTLEYKAYYGFTIFSQNQGSNPVRAQEGMEMIREVTRENDTQEVKLDSAWVLLAKAYRESGDKNKAFKAITKALKIKPSNIDAQRELKRIRGQDAQTNVTRDKKSGFFSGLFGGK